MEAGGYNIHGHVSLSPEQTSADNSGLFDLTPAGDNLASPLQPDGPRMQAVWEKAVGQELKIPYKYRHVAVLIVRWAEYLDRDLRCGDEVQALNNVFTKRYHFRSTILTLDDQRNPQLQLRNGIDTLVLNNDGPCRTHLLIVYYTGHGVGRGEDGLDISGVRDPNVSAIAQVFEPRANWNKAEDSLLDTARADVLTILDCCCAGNIMKGSTEDVRTFEVLAATAQKSPTEPPGPRSFTNALIGALEEQVEQPDLYHFNTFDLHSRIMKRRKNQRSQLFSRNPMANHRFIKLCPLERVDPIPESPVFSREASHLTVRFSFTDLASLDNKQVEDLAKRVSQGASDSNLGINRIDWIAFQARKQGDSPGAPQTLSLDEFVRVLRAVIKAQRLWRAYTQRSSARRPRSSSSENGHNPRKRARFLDVSTTSDGQGPSPPPSVGSSNASPAAEVIRSSPVHESNTALTDS